MTSIEVDAAQSRRGKRLQQLEVTIERWGRKLEAADRTVQRSVRMITKLQRQRQRLQKAMAKPPAVKPTQVESVQPLPKAIIEEARATADEPAIPTFLQRPFNPYEAEQREAKRAKSRVRIEKMKAGQSGDTKKMPLQGKEALAAIRG